MHLSCGLYWQRLQCLLWVFPPGDACSVAGGHRLLSWQQPGRQWSPGQRWRAVETAAPTEQSSLPQSCSGLVHRREVHVDHFSCKDGIEIPPPGHQHGACHHAQGHCQHEVLAYPHCAQGRPSASILHQGCCQQWQTLGNSVLQDKHLAALSGDYYCSGRVLHAACACVSADLHALCCGALTDGAPQCPPAAS